MVNDNDILRSFIERSLSQDSPGNDLEKIYRSLIQRNAAEETILDVVPKDYLAGHQLCISFEADLLFECSPITGNRVKDATFRKIVINPDMEKEGRYLVTMYQGARDRLVSQTTRPMYLKEVGNNYIDLEISPEDAVSGILGPEILRDRVVFKAGKILGVMLHRNDTGADYLYLSKQEALSVLIKACMDAMGSDDINLLDSEIDTLVNFLAGPSKMAILKECANPTGLVGCLIYFLDSKKWDSIESACNAAEIALFYLSNLIRDAITQSQVEEYQMELLRLVSISRPYLSRLARELVSSGLATEDSADIVLDKIAYYAALSQKMVIISNMDNLSSSDRDIISMALDGNGHSWKTGNAWDTPEDLGRMASMVETTLVLPFMDRNQSPIRMNMILHQ